MKNQTLEAIEKVSNRYYKLVLVVGGPYSGKTKLLRDLEAETGGHYVNLNLELSERLLGHSEQDRKNMVNTLLDDIVLEHGEGLLLFDNIEVLFDPNLDVNVLGFFRALSRRRSCVVAWSGSASSGVIWYGEPGKWGVYSDNIEELEFIDMSGERVEV